ncbi:MAG: hypothetical protein CMJ78_27805 [Planctomycetaceae bacterium]|nr:hypothetical protein [Planctomycetaceae bacterium]
MAGHSMNASFYIVGRGCFSLLLSAFLLIGGVSSFTETLCADEIPVTPLPDGLPGEVRVFRGHNVHIPSVAFLPDGRRVVSCSYDGTRIWDVETGKRVLDIRPGGLAALHPAGKEMAIRFGSAIRFFDVDSGKVLRELNPQPTDVTTKMTFSADGKLLAAAGPEKIIRIWDAETGKRVHELKGHTAHVKALAFHPSGKSLISGANDKTIRVWDLETGKESRKFHGTKFDQLSLQFSNDGRHVVSCGYYTNLKLWDFEQGTLVREFYGHIAGVHRAVFAPDGRRLISVADDQTLRCWDAQTGRELARLEGHQDYVLNVSISPDGRFAASVSGGDSEDGKWGGGDDFTVRIWRLPQLSIVDEKKPGLNLVNIEGGSGGEYAKLGGIGADVLSIDLSRDGRLLATGEKNGNVRVWEVESNRPIARFETHETMVRAVAISPDAKQLVTGTHGKKLRLWDMKSRQELLECPDVPSQVLGADFLRDGRVAFGVHGSVNIWNTETNKVTRLKPVNIHPHMIATSPDGSLVAAASHDLLVYVWDTSSGELLRSLKGHTDEVMSVGFSVDGLQVASGSRDKTVRLWDVQSGKQLKTFRGHSDWVWSVRLLPDGRRLMSGGGSNGGSIRTWDILTGEQIWWAGNDSKITRHLRVTPDSRFAVASNSAAVSILRLPGLRNTTELERYELARRNEGPSYRIAILDFVDKGPSVELAPLRKAIAELLTARLSQYRRIDAVERLQVEQFLKETKLGASGLVDATTAQQAEKVLTAEYLLSGTFSGEGKKITLDVTLVKVGAPEPVAQWSVSGPAADLFSIEQDLTNRTLGAFGIKRPKLEDNPPSESKDSPTVAVLSFRNLGQLNSTNDSSTREKVDSQLESMQAGIGEFLQATLSAFPDIKLVDREDLDAVLAEQELALSGITDRATAARIGKIVGAKRFIYGSFIQSNSKISIIARLADTETATILHTEIADGTADDIGATLEKLSMRLARSMNVQLPKNAELLVQRSVPIRKLEAAVYGSRAMAMVRKGNFDAAFQDFDRALLVESNNLELRKQYVRALYRLGRTDKLIELAEETLAMAIPKHLSLLKSTIYAYYLNSLLRSGEHTKRVEVARQYAKEFPGSSYKQRRARAAEARSLRGSNRRSEAIALLEAEVMKAEASNDDIRFGDELAELFKFYDSELSFYQGGSRVPKVTEESAARAVEVAERLLAHCKGRKGRSAAYWGRVLVPRVTTLTYYKEGSRYSKFYLDVDERIDFLNRARSVFAWDREILSRAAFELGKHSDRGERYDDALQGFREFLQIKFYNPSGVISSYDRSYIQPNDWIDHQIEAQYRIARILHEDMDKRDEPIAAYQEYVQKYGLATFHGPHVSKGLTDLVVEPEFPEKSVLLWGGATEALKSWQKVLTPLGYTTHTVRQYHLTAADLAPYDIVILIRSGDIPFDPVDTLGLRSYVATGGSLLVVLSPAYEGATPGIHNWLLSYFGVKAGADHIETAPASFINSEHPITSKVPAATARHAVSLTVPQGTSLIESDGKTVLAAMPYRHGQVVVSSFGQWLFPDPTIYGNGWQRHLNWYYGSTRSLKSMPIESFTGTNATLLKQTIDWLAKKPDDLAEKRSVFQAAWLALRQFEGRAIERSSMTKAMDDLIDQTASDWREEALWLAGEAHQRLNYFYTKYHLHWPTYGWSRSDGTLQLKRDYFETLIADYPDSPLLTTAQWRAVECDRRAIMRGWTSSRHSLSEEVTSKLIADYEKVTAPEGSYPWAWAKWRIGRLHFFSENYEQAIEQFRQVSERMPPCPLKILALLDIANCSQKLDRPNQAKKAAEAVMALPNVEWWDRAYERVCPLLGRSGNSKYFASRVLR